MKTAVIKRWIALGFLLPAFFASFLIVDTVSPQADPQRLGTVENKKRELAEVLRERIANGKTSDPAFWRDVAQLEQLGPADVKIAVVRHANATLVYEYKNVNGIAVADGDLMLGPYHLVQARQTALRTRSQVSVFAALPSQNAAVWPTNVIPFEIADDLEAVGRLAIGDAMNHYEGLTPVRFRRRQGETEYLRFVKQWPFLSSMSDVGPNGGKIELKLQTRENDNTLKTRGDVDATARHEIGHALGLTHEHNRSDRKNYISMDLDCTDFIYRITGNYSIKDDSRNIGPYDFQSIMHYPSSKGTKGFPWHPKPCFDFVKIIDRREDPNSTGEIGFNSVLSSHDINALFHLYGPDGVRGRSGDQYGSAVLVHDFDPVPDKVNYLDLAVGAPGRDRDTGVVFLYKGTAEGFVLWKIIAPPSSRAGQRFGEALAAGDFNGDGKQQLAVGAPGSTFNGKSAAGKVFIFRIRSDPSLTHTLTKPATDNPTEAEDRFGHALTAGVVLERSNEPADPVRIHLAIGAPGARNGLEGRVGQVWVWKNERGGTQRLIPVTVPGVGPRKFGRFGYALTILKDRLENERHPLDQLVIGAPGVTMGNCGHPSVFIATVVNGTIQTVSSLPQRSPAPPADRCPQDQNLTDATDFFPGYTTVMFGNRLASGDFNGDGKADLAVSESANVHEYRRNDLGELVFKKTLLNADFGETRFENSFGVALAAGNLEPASPDDLVVGATDAPLNDLDQVGKIYVYSGCGPGSPDEPGQSQPDPQPDPQPEPPPLFSMLTVPPCDGLRPWFMANELDFQSSSLRISVIGALYPPFTEAVKRDHFGRGLAIAEGTSGIETTLFVGSQDKAQSGRARAGAVFLFLPSLTDDLPAFRNQRALTPAFTTRIRRN